MNRDYYAGMLQGRLEERERIVRLLDFEEFYEAVAFLISEYPDVARVSENNDKGE